MTYTETVTALMLWMMGGSAVITGVCFVLAGAWYYLTEGRK